MDWGEIRDIAPKTSLSEEEKPKIVLLWDFEHMRVRLVLLYFLFEILKGLFIWKKTFNPDLSVERVIVLERFFIEQILYLHSCFLKETSKNNFKIKVFDVKRTLR